MGIYKFSIYSMIHMSKETGEFPTSYVFISTIKA